MTRAIGFHDALAREFGDKYLTRTGFKARLVVWEQLIREHSDASTRAMDLGCGPGWMTSVLCERATNVVAIDGSEQMLTVARRNVGNSRNVEFVHAEITPALFARWGTETFGMVICSSVLEYLSGADGVLDEVFRLLAPGGTIMFSVPNTRSLFRHIESLTFRVFGRPAYRRVVVNSWTPRTTVELLQHTGFQVERVVFDGHVPGYSTLFSWLPESVRSPMMIVIARKVR